jgi:hypothetical protein
MKKTGNKKPRKGSQRKDLRWLIFPLAGLAALLLIGLISAFGGYSSGIGLRQDAESTQLAQSAEQQFQLGCRTWRTATTHARQHFEYIIQLRQAVLGDRKLAEALST